MKKKKKSYVFLNLESGKEVGRGEREPRGGTRNSSMVLREGKNQAGPHHIWEVYPRAVCGAGAEGTTDVLLLDQTNSADGFYVYFDQFSVFQ